MGVGGEAMWEMNIFSICYSRNRIYVTGTRKKAVIGIHDCRSTRFIDKCNAGIETQNDFNSVVILRHVPLLHLCFSGPVMWTVLDRCHPEPVCQRLSSRFVLPRRGSKATEVHFLIILWCVGRRIVKYGGVQNMQWFLTLTSLERWSTWISLFSRQIVWNDVCPSTDKASVYMQSPGSEIRFKMHNEPFWIVVERFASFATPPPDFRRLLFVVKR